MFLKPNKRFKDDKEHIYYTLYESLKRLAGSVERGHVRSYDVLIKRLGRLQERYVQVFGVPGTWRVEAQELISGHTASAEVVVGAT